MSSDSKPYMELIHESLEQAKQDKDEKLFAFAYADAVTLSKLEHNLNTYTARHPHE